MSPSEISYKDGRKTLVPLENNENVFADLARQLGMTLPPSLGFHDVYGLDPDALSFTPRPVHALLCTVPAPTYYRVRANDSKLAYEGAGPGEPVTWFRQTVGNVCGLVSFLHAVSNSPAAKDFIGPDLQKLFADAQALRPTERAQLLYDSELLEKAHRAVAGTGDSVNPGSENETSNHFITFVKTEDERLWELEGVWGGPIELCTLGKGEDVLSEKALEAGIKRFFEVSEGDSNFSMVALAGEPESQS